MIYMERRPGRALPVLPQRQLDEPELLPDPDHIGNMVEQCPHCHALLFSSEKNKRKPFWNMCCKNGKVNGSIS